MSEPIVLTIEHAADCGPAHLGDWLADAGLELVRSQPFAGDPQPTTSAGWSGLLVLGGDMGAYDDAVAPWLPATRRLLADAVEQGLPTLGVCLGHQLLAVATGGRVERSAVGRQLGVLDVGLTAAGRADPLLGSPDAARAIHWNNDLVVELPPGATELARTREGVQAMRVGAAAWGVQFHPEIGAAEIAAWADSAALGEGVSPRRLAQMTAAEPGLHATWRAFAHRFAAIVRHAARHGARHGG